MTRLSSDEIVNGHVYNGYDYALQVWVQHGIIQPCAHPLRMRAHGPCCSQNKLAGLMICDVPGHSRRDR
jgi:hypothetical protein